MASQADKKGEFRKYLERKNVVRSAAVPAHEDRRTREEIDACACATDTTADGEQGRGFHAGINSSFIHSHLCIISSSSSTLQ